MERDLTSGSVFKTVVYFFFTVLVVILFADIIWNGRSVHCRAVRRSQQYDSSVDRKSDHAYVNGNDSGTCHGFDSDDRS